ISAKPVLDALAAGTTADVHFQYVPHDARASDIAALTQEILRVHLPPVKRCVAHAPADLEKLEGWPQGQPHHAELSLDQALWMRPLPELARYKTPIAGLWLCGPAMHPGAGVVG